MSTNPQPPQPGSSDAQPDSTAPQPAAEAFDPAKLKLALKAFKKRLKMANLDHDSRLGHGPMSSGGRASIVAIVPPDNYPRAIWEELARLGKLRRAGQGMYELGDQP